MRLKATDARRSSDARGEPAARGSSPERASDVIVGVPPPRAWTRGARGGTREEELARSTREEEGQEEERSAGALSSASPCSARRRGSFALSSGCTVRPLRKSRGGRPRLAAEAAEALPGLPLLAGRGDAEPDSSSTPMRLKATDARRSSDARGEPAARGSSPERASDVIVGVPPPRAWTRAPFWVTQIFATLHHGCICTRRAPLIRCARPPAARTDGWQFNV
ncbi:unnamed protein product [Prorocentrum cordatum]|uniref:Uncharacterized protein n=1 Tax=Prorocentrum cordatum TaxID=2364126 RepID=A0ABN9PP07_9DINO|nr:unnamed protein product [Polarella glacialis]